MKKTILAVLLGTIAIPGLCNGFGRFSEKRTQFILKHQEQLKEKQPPINLSPYIKSIKNIQYANYSKDNALDIYYKEAKMTNKPVVIMVHGGGWLAGDKGMDNIVRNKAEYFVGEKDYIFVSINYRMEPNNIHPQEVSDVAEAINWVYKNIKSYSGDPNKIILMGHSAGAHLVALATTDQKYLNKLGMPVSAIKGVVPLDGPYDLPYLIRSDQIIKDIGRDIIGRKALEKIRSIDETAWKNYNDAVLNDASPINYVNRNVPSTLLISSSNNKPHELVANKFQNALNAQNVFVARKDFPLTHEEINDFVGLPNHDLTITIQNFIDRVIH